MFGNWDSGGSEVRMKFWFFLVTVARGRGASLESWDNFGHFYQKILKKLFKKKLS